MSDKNNKSNLVLKTKWGTARINNSGYYWITTYKDGNRGKLLHKLIWIEHNGPIPEGYVVHHHDHNKLNNNINNLELMTLSEHTTYHNKNMSDERKQKISKAMLGDKNPNYGGLSEETKTKMSKVKLGKRPNNFNPIIKIRKIKSKTSKQGYMWGAHPSTHEKQISLCSTNLNECIKKVVDFINGEKNTKGYTNYEIINSKL